MKVSYHVFKDYKLRTDAQTDEEAFLKLTLQQKAKARQNRYSFVSFCHHPERRRLFVGATHGLGDILLEFDPAKGTFRSCGYARSGLWRKPEGKIHKGLWLDEDEDALYFGTAGLAAFHETIDAPGGKLVRYDIAKRKFTCLGQPTPGDYFQGTVYDGRRKIMYIYTIRGCFVVYDLRKKKVIRCVSMRSIPHCGCLDDDGAVWGTYGPRPQAFFRYHPARDKFQFFAKCQYPNAYEAANIQFIGAGPVDSIINGGDGFLYTGSALGELYRIEPRKGEIEYLGKPFPEIRLPGLALGQDGWIYLAGGNRRASSLARYSRTEKRFELLGSVEHKNGTYLHYAHELAMIDGVAYLGETDNMTRSGYLWECRLG